MGTHRGWDASPMQSTILTHLCLGTNKSTEYTYQQVFGKSGKKSENPEETHVAMGSTWKNFTQTVTWTQDHTGDLVRIPCHLLGITESHFCIFVV